MAPRKKTGRAAAEAAYANLLKDNTALVGDVGETWDAYVAQLHDAAAARERYEDARTAAVKGGAVTNDQLDQMGYKKTAKLPTPPPRTPATPASEISAASKPDATAGRPEPLSDPQTNGVSAEPALASVGAANRGEY
ncbi:hypothetical protein BRW65_26830 [Mycobacterium paraffinicum]|uniref:Uncharacterized protein n=1 Tax=Mycobacterium paraffinicum TaxID=53378 RepID=A0A1Q4HGW0_9MYCO|nr:hypothetical protein [Mycobacterium paraffinicum]OJZ66757.1 hypothetical protein BRW65_26830 [Mycobacterium paraffinicum]